MARPDPIRLRILNTLKAHLEGITPENGYDHDMAGRFFMGRSIFGSEAQVPFYSVLEAPRPNELIGGGQDKVKRIVTWDLLLQGFVENDPINPIAPAHRLLAETELRLSELISENQGRPNHPSIYRIANLATDVLIGQGVARPATEKVSPNAFIYLPLTVKFANDLSKPYGE